MTTIHIEGLNICAFASDRLKVCMLNSAFNPDLEIPFHLQTLVVNRSSVDAESMAPLPTLRGRIRFPEGVTSPDQLDAEYVGWDLTGFNVSIHPDGGATGRPKALPSAVAPKQRNPDPVNPDWSDIHWVIDVNAFAPTAKLKTSAQRLGAHALTIVEIRGGRVRGGQAVNMKDSAFVWDFGNQVQQAVTDIIDYLADERLIIEFGDSAGASRGGIRLSADANAFLFNEATPVDVFNESKALGAAAAPTRHAHAFFEALESDQPLAPPTRKERFRTSPTGPSAVGIVEGTYCIVMRIEV